MKSTLLIISSFVLSVAFNIALINRMVSTMMLRSGSYDSSSYGSQNMYAQPSYTTAPSYTINQYSAQPYQTPATPTYQVPSYNAQPSYESAPTSYPTPSYGSQTSKPPHRHTNIKLMVLHHTVLSHLTEKLNINHKCQHTVSKSHQLHIKHPQHHHTECNHLMELIIFNI